ncbi:MAG: TetR/AcrR family transcriptional regulator [Acidimicrobiales bacterium]
MAPADPDIDLDADPDPDDQADPGSGAWVEGLRERKKRLTRALISDTATAMFLERGFEEVKVADVAEACGVSEKTIYNYFATKESLLFDGEAEIAASIWEALGPRSLQRSPVAAALGLLGDELGARCTDELGTEMLARSAQLIASTPSLQAAEREMFGRLEVTAAQALAARARVSPDRPEPRIAAVALVGLGRLQTETVRRLALAGRSVREIREVASEEVRRAGRVVESGLLWLDLLDDDGRPGAAQLNSAASAVTTCAREVLVALRQARSAWEQFQGEKVSMDPRSMGGLASWIEEAERWKRDFKGQKDEWKIAYREHQARLREAQRELRQRLRQTHWERTELTRPAQRSRRPGPGPRFGQGRPL